MKWILLPDPEGWTIESNGQTVTRFDATEEHARLIAAAPDLLASLEKLVAAEATGYEVATMRYEQMFAGARAAIAKARA